MLKRLVVLTASALVVLVVVWVLREEPESEVISKTVEFQYQYIVENTTSEVFRNQVISLYVPMDIVNVQKLVNGNINYEYAESEDALGNRIWNVKLGGFSPYETKIIDVNFTVEKTSENVRLSGDDGNEFLVNQRFLSMDNSKLQSQAKLLKRESALETAKATYSWVASHVEYEGVITKDLGALYAMMKKQGDCTEYMYLFSALARINGLPTRHMGGYRTQAGKQLGAKIYHNWVEVLIGDEWLLVDPQTQAFESHQQDFVVFRIAGSKDDSQPFSKRYFGTSEHIKVQII